jgi:hypothetical protein
MSNDIANFKAFPARRDEPVSFSTKYDEFQSKMNNPVDSNFLFSEQA